MQFADAVSWVLASVIPLARARGLLWPQPPRSPQNPRQRLTCTTFAGGKPLKWVELAAE
jgi:hypothetical protein